MKPSKKIAPQKQPVKGKQLVIRIEHRVRLKNNRHGYFVPVNFVKKIINACATNK